MSDTATMPQETTLSLVLRQRDTVSCGLCLNRLREAVAARPGVTGVQANSQAGVLTVAYNAACVSGEEIEREARRLETDIAAQYGHRLYAVAGMDCAHCAEGLERMARGLPGVLDASVQFSAAKMRLEFDATTPASAAKVVRRAKEMGFTLTEGKPIAQKASWYAPLVSNAGRAILSAAFLTVGLLLEHVFHAPEVAARLIYGAAILVGGWRFALSGLAALKGRVVGTNLLMALAAVGAVAIGRWEEAAMVISLYAVGVALEGAAMERTRRSLSALIDARPLEAEVEDTDGQTEIVLAETVAVGSILLLRPGAKIAADGIILSGFSAISEAAITGESVPKDKTPGDTVYAGSVNGSGVLRVRVTAPASDSTLARVLHLVEEAQAKKAPTQAFVEKFGRIYTPLVLVAAILTALVGPLLAPGVDWIYRALTLLVVSCPCALIIATPVAYVSAIACAARSGVLVKGGIHLETLAATRRVFLDKTGTLTTGELKVMTAAMVREAHHSRVLSLAAAIERQSEHPIARAVVAAADAEGVERLTATQAAAVPGKGMTALVEGREAIIGNAAFLMERGYAISPEVAAEEQQLRDAGQTTLMVGQEGAALGVIAVADTVRPEAREAIAALLRSGRTIAMLTGDNAASAQRIGQEVSITDCRAGLLPQEKLAAVEDAIASGESVVFVGDGINDAPSLVAANVGIAMGAGGTAAALEAADIALMRSDLSRLPYIIRLAETTRRIVRWNVAIAVGAVLLMLVGVLIGKVSLPLGVLAHEGSALIVILNGIRLLSRRFVTA